MPLGRAPTAPRATRHARAAPATPSLARVKGPLPSVRTSAMRPDMVAAASIDWDGSDPKRQLG